MTERQENIKKQLLELIQDGDRIALVRVGGTARSRQWEIIVAPEKGQPQFVTSWVCTLLDVRRGGRDHNGGLRLGHFATLQDLCEQIREALGIKLDFTTNY